MSSSKIFYWVEILSKKYPVNHYLPGKVIVALNFADIGEPWSKKKKTVKEQLSKRCFEEEKKSLSFLIHTNKSLGHVGV